MIIATKIATTIPETHSYSKTILQQDTENAVFSLRYISIEYSIHIIFSCIVSIYVPVTQGS